eukprot:CAMPEP_0168478264 /NCGR_PEP_ID=MMETSP0228-20121227/62856_1 /TAXON_ID=133427 /ORGANISM="Protoceratium reticulatum, Strain CCCM 535 (=CCMP 1889)" /LENGTH=61 /DNA_ID=CAMNT_0008494495 /DNA_START=129 /DNA_END=311 /DNA_ORIENTATION=-
MRSCKQISCSLENPTTPTEHHLGDVCPRARAYMPRSPELCTKLCTDTDARVLCSLLCETTS